MSFAELAAHGRRKIHQTSDSFFSSSRFAKVAPVGEGIAFPKLPPPESAPDGLRTALRRDVADIQAGRWMAFGYLPLQLEDPPRWQKDYLVNIDLATRQRALKLHHRLEGQADIKLIWEPSRWYSLVRLAQGAYVLGDATAASTCRRWLEDWARENPPYFGWHWTSGLESGIRLIQFVWIDALLSTMSAAGHDSRDQSAPNSSGQNRAAALPESRKAILPPHLWFTWRDRSFGSSANNHLLGELAGLILAVARWPDMASWAVPLERLQPLWEEQVLTQFAADGGNREQALNYHLFGWEFCWQARLALRAAGRPISAAVEDRLRAGAGFFTGVQVDRNAWDYGDSDNAYVTPFFSEWPEATAEWLSWLREPRRSPSISYWIGDAPKAAPNVFVQAGAKGWRVYGETGLAVFEDQDWFLRWDLSPLGYLRTAGHGHCDALHLSAWFKGEAFLIDPGTGTYHADRPLRDYLASWEAHNGPHRTGETTPRRMGTFLWAEHHARPRWERLSDLSMRSELQLAAGIMRRTMTRLEGKNGWQIDDSYCGRSPTTRDETTVLWQFGPAAGLSRVSDRRFVVQLERNALQMEIAKSWQRITPWSPGSTPDPPPAPGRPGGLCSSAFRQVREAPCVLLQGTVTDPDVLRTVFSVAD
jgi:hypothetical protein